MIDPNDVVSDLSRLFGAIDQMPDSVRDVFMKTFTDELGVAPTRPIMAMIGDSISVKDSPVGNQVVPNPTPNINKQAGGFGAVALALSGQRVRMPAATHVWGFPSQDSDVILKVLPRFLNSLAVKPGVMIIECGTNDIYHATTPELVATAFQRITDNWKAMAQMLLAQNIRVIFIPILPRGAGFSALFSGEQFNVLDRCNRWLARFAQTSSGSIAAATGCLPYIADPSLSGSQPKTGFTDQSDGGGTHLNVTSAFYIGREVANILKHWYPPVDLLPNNNLTYSLTQPYANMILNGMLTGTGGTVGSANGSTVTGNVPTSWSSAYNGSLTGLTVAHSAAVGLSGLPMHQLAISGTHASASDTSSPPYVRLSQFCPSVVYNNIQAGDVVEALVAFEIDAGNGVIARPKLELRWDNSSFFNQDMADDAGGFWDGSQAISGVLRTAQHVFTPAEIPVASGDMAILFSAMLRKSADVTGSGTIRFGRAVIQKVESATL